MDEILNLIESVPEGFPSYFQMFTVDVKQQFNNNNRINVTSSRSMQHNTVDTTFHVVCRLGNAERDFYLSFLR